MDFGEKSALVAMSGGVDSSVTAYLLKERGFFCVGATMRLYGNRDLGLESAKTLKTCCSIRDMEDAGGVAALLGMPYQVLDYKEDFREKVIDKFVRVYENGGTPNPCIDCNRYLKFDKMLEEADNWGLKYVASGHYARIEREPASGRYLLKKGADETKDQSYVLYMLTQEQLSRILMPLGELRKNEVRKIAERAGFANAGKSDSQDICFAPDGDYAAFLERDRGASYPEGDFVDEDGKPLGRHKGIIRYTVGQRKGLGIALGKPAFVLAINADKNEVVLSTDESRLFTRRVELEDVNLIPFDELGGPLRVTAKLRYSHRESPATLRQTDAERFELEFDEPQRAPTAGQAAVFYDGDTVLGGGTIVV